MFGSLGTMVSNALSSDVGQQLTQAGLEYGITEYAARNSTQPDPHPASPVAAPRELTEPEAEQAGFKMPVWGWFASAFGLVLVYRLIFDRPRR